jgi:hypothetical protein
MPRTSRPIYVVGRVSREGQQDLGNQTDIKYATNHAAAVAEAKALLAPDWSEIPLILSSS